MKRKDFRLGLLLLVLLATLPLKGDDPPTLTLSEAVEKALEQNRDLLLERDRVLVAGLNARQSRNSLLPSLSLSADTQKRYASKSSSGSGNSSSASFTLGAELNIFRGFADRATIEGTRLEALQAGKALSHSERATLFNSAATYLRTVITQSFIAVEEENLRAQEAQLQLIEEFVNAGKRPRADLFLQKADMATSELRLLEARRADHIQKLQLMLLMGTPPRGDIRVTDPGIDRMTSELPRGELEKAVQNAFAQRADLQAQDLALLAARSDIQVARAAYWPTISLFTRVGGSYSNAQSHETLTRQLFDQNLSASAGLSISIPLFDRLETAHRVALARLALHSAQVQRDQLRERIAQEIGEAQEEYRTARQEIAASKSQVTYSEQALESIEARYRVNAATMAELIQARSQMVSSRYTLISSRFNLMIRALNLACVSGSEALLKSMLSIQ